ncbi:DUF6088 family protein [Acinetobacter junii]|jgi:hypothetical protein|uniref:S-adenosylhomocysteine hydrolase n=1 Tax=Acinetobacter junii TaxID=40215 RepID=A0AAW5RFW6_ACIJU|nr:DUF6088 family protein [Acinetobacter junii]MCU4398354.1 hypothetical protein [Acinetobacter junii]MDH1857872.1 DUF6088 family protein [Acinetobacter junii]MDU2409639.1 DUF6088 family protein [Acinetobacter junii]
MIIKDKILKRIQDAENYVFMRQDFSDIANYDQVGRALRELVQDEKLLKVGYGIYTKARINSITGKIMPACPVGADGVILEALERLGVKYTFGKATAAYLESRSNQIPPSLQIETPRRFKRQLSAGRKQINVNISQGKA